MEKYIIMGGIPLSGSVKISGAKNAVLPILAASLLSSGVTTINDVPRLKDVQVMKEVLEFLGCSVEWSGTTMKIDGSKVSSIEVSDFLMRKMRASNLVMGPLLTKFGMAKLSFPGGCAIGSRPMDLHLKGLATMGAKIEERFGFIEAVAPGGRLEGSEICLDFPSVGATENLMMAAVLAKGKTVISNAAKEPEIVELQNFLNKMGAKISGAGTDVITVIGVDGLSSTEHTVIPDRIEAGTFMTAAAITKGNIKILNANIRHMEAVVAKLREMGVKIIEEAGGIRVIGTDNIKAVDVKTMPYPGFPTDMQPQIMALLAVAHGTSIISENIFENRFKHVDELRRMGADIKVEGRIAVIKGKRSLSGTFVNASDLRAGAALAIAGLGAEDATIVDSIYHIDRGYENFEQKLRGLGAKIIRVTETNRTGIK
ncbi:MAG: UDP-N-acetylglucosamine 1-carboxyvinyltransferase [Clostridia bacterium]|nr:UDP-N-acetylglucosamine 1-carboxyvinyltransferase [Clostridia bacterium]